MFISKANWFLSEESRSVIIMEVGMAMFPLSVAAVATCTHRLPGFSYIVKFSREMPTLKNIEI